MVRLFSVINLISVLNLRILVLLSHSSFHHKVIETAGTEFCFFTSDAGLVIGLVGFLGYL